MRFCTPANVSVILVGLYKVGIVGLRDALRKVTESGLTEREEIVDFILQSLADRNYIPDTQGELYRQAVWREFLRHRREDFSPFFSEIEVTVRGKAGDERDRFVQMLVSVFGDFELKPNITFHPPDEADPTSELLLGEEAVARAGMSRAQVRAAVHRHVGDW